MLTYAQIAATNEAWHDAANAFQHLLLATHDTAIADSLTPAFLELRTQAVRRFEAAQEKARTAREGALAAGELFPHALGEVP